MPVDEASAMCPALELLPYDPQADRIALEELVEAAHEFSPLVGLEQIDSTPWTGRHLAEPQSIFADVTNLTHFFNGPELMATAIADWFMQKGYQALVAIAPSVGSAWAAANYHHRHLLYADDYDQRQSMPSIYYSPTQTNDMLRRLDIAALRLNADQYKTLHRLGIRTIEALLALPRSGLAPRLGMPLLHRIDSLMGDTQEPINYHHAGPEFYVDMTLEIPTDQRATIEELIRRLCNALCKRLMQHGKGALRLLCRLSTVETSMLIFKLGLYRPTAEVDHLQRLLLGQFEQHVRRAITVKALSIQATIVDDLRWRQTNLFEQAEESIKNKAAELIDVLASRIGSEAVLTAVVKPNPLPEAARQFQPLTGKLATISASKNQRAKSTKVAEPIESFEAIGVAASKDDPMRRPLCLKMKPIELEVLAIYPNGPPIRFRFEGKLENVTQHWGPERIETGWWSGPTQRRDYYRVETQMGTWHWLYRDLVDGQWYLHGSFA
jgi:protein ImuB